MTKGEARVLIDEAWKFSVAGGRYGGSFIKALASAVQKADLENTRKIRDTFPEYWNKYLNVYDERMVK